MSDLPEFSAEEINVLGKSARRNKYHERCFDFILNLEENKNSLTEIQKN